VRVVVGREPLRKLLVQPVHRGGEPRREPGDRAERPSADGKKKTKQRQDKDKSERLFSV
jgi:hypothetical protein